jgi:thiamine transport system ATP-binding protein
MMFRCDKMTFVQGTFTLSADMTFAKGAVTAVIGPSGAGKSTLLLAIAGFIAAQDGEMSWNGVPFTNDVPGKRPVSMLFQDNNLFGHVSVAQNVGFGLRARGKLTAQEKQTVRDVLADVGLAEMGDRLPAALSGGQQSRAALARLLLADRPIVLLDEPFAALGPGLKTDMLDLTAQVLLRHKDRTVLMVSHDPEDARRIATYVVWVEDGVVYPPRATAEMFANPPVGLRRYLGKIDENKSDIA